MEHFVQPVEMRKVTCRAQPHFAKGSNQGIGTSQTRVPEPNFSVARMVKTVNASDASHPGRRRACTIVSGVDGEKWASIHTSSRPKEPALFLARNQSLVMTINELAPCSTPAYMGIHDRRSGFA